MITQEEVVWLYRCLLGREPESSAVIAETLSRCPDFMTARAQIMASQEFANLNMASTFYRHGGSVLPATRARAKTLALASIVKNEEKNIEFMLLSCLPIVDYVAIVDTGSTDRTLSIARNVLAKSGVRFAIETRNFTNFSEARNAALALVPADLSWTLMLDADEHLVQEDYWRLNCLLDANVDGWQLPRFNFHDAGKKGAVRPYPDYQKRLLRNRADRPIRFKGAVHEEPVNVGSWGFAPPSDGGREGFVGGPHIHHMGQVSLTLEQWQRKHDFYTRLKMLSSVKQDA